jgi:hypothetical protein
MNAMTPQTTMLLASISLAGYLMLTTGIQKKALEWRRRRRVCAVCGKPIRGRTVCGCAD